MLRHRLWNKRITPFEDTLIDPKRKSLHLVQVEKTSILSILQRTTRNLESIHKNMGHKSGETLDRVNTVSIIRHNHNLQIS